MAWGQGAPMQQLQRQPSEQQQQQGQQQRYRPMPALDRARYICAQLSNATKVLPLLTERAEQNTLLAIQAGALFK